MDFNDYFVSRTIPGARHVFKGKVIKDQIDDAFTRWMYQCYYSI